MENELIDLRQLRAFKALAQTGSFTSAAQQLFLTQSAVSHSIKGLEDSLGCSLFDRLGKSISLTRQGQALLSHVEEIFAQLHQAREEVKSLTEPGPRSIRVGAPDTVCQNLLPLVLEEFKVRIPKSRVEIQVGDTPEIVRKLQGTELDLAIGLRNLSVDGGHRIEPLFDDEMVMIFSPEHPWANLDEIPEQDVVQERLIVYARQSASYGLIESHFSSKGLKLSRPLEVGNMETIKQLALSKQGIGIVSPWVAQEQLESKKLQSRRIGKEGIRREWVVYTSNKAPQQSENGKVFIEVCQSVARRLYPGD